MIKAIAIGICNLSKCLEFDYFKFNFGAKDEESRQQFRQLYGA